MRILVTCSSGFGHLNPLVAVARAAEAAGHEILLASGPDTVERARQLGFRTAVAGPAHTDARARLDRTELASIHPEARLAFMIERLFAGIAAPGRLADLEELTTTWRPALILHEPTEFAAPLLAAARDLPSVCHGFGPAFPTQILDRAAAAMAPLWRERGLDAPEAAGIHRGPTIDPCPPSLATVPVPDAWPVRPVPGDAAPDERLPDAVADFLSTDAVHVSFGTVFNENLGGIVAIVRGVAAFGRPVVATLGPGVDPRLVSGLGPNVLVADYLPQSQLMPHCALSVNHGGASSVLTALAAAVPQVLVPHGADHFWNAAACERAHVATVLRLAGLDEAAAARAAERTMTDAAIRVSVDRAAGEIASMPDPVDVVERLSSLV